MARRRRKRTGDNRPVMASALADRSPPFWSGVMALGMAVAVIAGAFIGLKVERSRLSTKHTTTTARTARTRKLTAKQRALVRRRAALHRRAVLRQRQRARAKAHKKKALADGRAPGVLADETTGRVAALAAVW